jgi:hypothetical protein
MILPIRACARMARPAVAPYQQPSHFVSDRYWEMRKPAGNSALMAAASLEPCL